MQYDARAKPISIPFLKAEWCILNMSSLVTINLKFVRLRVFFFNTSTSWLEDHISRWWNSMSHITMSMCFTYSWKLGLCVMWVDWWL